MKKRMIALLIALCIIIGTGVIQTPALAASVKVYVSANTLPVYNRVSGQTVLLGTMSFGESMTCLAVNNNWACVKNASGAIGYCKTSGLTNINPNKYSVKLYANASNVKVYAKPDTSSSVLKTIGLNDSYIGVAITSDSKWIRLKNGSSYGYVLAPQMSAEPVNSGAIAYADTVYVGCNTLAVYAGARTSSKKLGTMAYGESMGLLGTSGEWAKVVNSEGTVGYCKSVNLLTSDPNTLNATVFAASNGVKVYKKPTTSSGVLKKAAQNESFTVVAATPDGEWLRLKNGSSYGYIKAEDVSTAIETESTVYVCDNTLPVYTDASDSGKLLGTMCYGESMELIEANEGSLWVKVRNTSGATGYCLVSGLTTENPNQYNTTIYIAEDGTNIYKKPDTSFGVSATVNQNATFIAVAITEDNQWMRIIYGSGYGYVMIDSVSDTIIDNTPDPTAIYVSANTLPVYAAEDTSSKILGTMAYGEEMTLLSVDDGWAKVQNTSGSIGYCTYGSLTSENPNTLNETMYAQSKITLYKKPSTGFGSVQSVSVNTVLTVVATTPDGEWARIALSPVSYAYVQMKNLAGEKVDPDDAFADPDYTNKTVYGVATTTTCYATASTSAKSVGHLYFGQSATCTGVSGEWARVVNGSGTVAYCKLANISTENPNKYSVSVYAVSAGTKVYQKPSTSSSVIATVSKNGKCTAIAVSTDGKWYRLKNGSTYGYVLASDFSTSATSEDSTTSAKITKVISLAEKQYGKNYVYGAKGPNSFDCSGLVYYAFKNGAGITLPRTAEKMGYSSSYTKISNISDLKKGDLVFFDTSSDSDLCDHVGIYLGSGYFVHASSAAGKVVKSSLENGYYSRVFSWGRRVI